MRLSTTLSVALAAAPIAVSAAGTLGFALGFQNPDGSCKKTSDYEDDFDALKPYTSIVRMYSSAGCDAAKNVLPAAIKKKFKVVLGVWPDTEDSYNKDKTALKAVLTDGEHTDAVYAITCGSEALYRGDMKAKDLLDRINDMKKTFPTVKVGFADSWNKFADGTADPLIQGGVKLMMVNGFSFWQAQEIKNASHSYLDDMFQATTHIQNIAGSIDDIEIWNGETGWPTDGGSDYLPSKAGTKNAETFFKEGVCGALNWGLNVFYFEAFDEPAKEPAIGENGGKVDETKWGAFTAKRESKFSIGC